MKTQYLLPLLVVLHTSCTGQDKMQKAARTHLDPAESDSAIQVSQYIPCILQDRAGDIWFGTNGDGVCRYNGKELTYFNTTEGFVGSGVRDIIEVENGDLWFATTNGVTRYDGKHFTNFTTRDGLIHNQVWSILKDRSGTFWFGTDGGVSRYDGKTFTSFPLPAADLTKYPGTYGAPRLVHDIVQDKNGDIWLATNGLGVYRYDGRSLINISEKDGLVSNVVIHIIQDKNGHLWFGSSQGYQGPESLGIGGLTRYDGKSLTSFTTKEGMSGNMVWTMLEDKKGNIWVATGRGLDRYDGKSFTNFTKKDGLASKYVQAMLEDNAGNLWLGTSGGVYRFNGERFINFTRKGLVK